MLGYLLDGLEAAAAPLRRVVIYQGFKIYGIHLGAKVRTPARASDPPHMPPNIQHICGPRDICGPRGAAQGRVPRRAAGIMWR
jgi:hypothetical protein